MTKAMTKREGDYYQQFFDVLTDEEQAELNRLVKKLLMVNLNSICPIARVA